MERFARKATFNGNDNLSQRHNPQGNEASHRFSAFPLKLNLRDASFSSYLQRQEEPKSVAAHGVVLQEDTELNIFQAERYFNETQNQKSKSSSSCSSLSVVNFDDRIDISSINPRLSSVSSVDGYGTRNCRTGSFHATPTTSSEASWNSQSGLLSIPTGSIAVSMRNLPLDGNIGNGNPNEEKKGSSTKCFFRLKCPCSGKKSVQVVEESPVAFNSDPSNGSLNHTKQNSKAREMGLDNAPNVERSPGIDEKANLKLAIGGWAKEQERIRGDSGRISPENHFQSEIICNGQVVPSGSSSFGDGSCFSFPILNPSVAGKLSLNNSKPKSDVEEDPPRDSLEVFQMSDEPIIRNPTEIQHSLSTTPGDSDRRSFTFPTKEDDDVASDASSDLFEIESFSTQTTSHPILHRRRDSIDEIMSYNQRRFVGHGRGILHSRRSLDETRTPSSEYYDPSEASIDWSASTPETLNRISVTSLSVAASNYKEIRLTRADSEKLLADGANGGSKWKGNRFFNCGCENVTNVGPRPVKCVSGQCDRRPPLALESGHIPANIASMNVIRASGKPPLARSHSARALAKH